MNWKLWMDLLFIDIKKNLKKITIQVSGRRISIASESTLSHGSMWIQIKDYTIGPMGLNHLSETQESKE